MSDGRLPVVLGSQRGLCHGSWNLKAVVIAVASPWGEQHG